MTKGKKKPGKAHLVVDDDKKADPSPDSGGQENKRHKEDFERLLDDAILGLDKKK